ncbi:MAG: DUF1818 family protein [Pseudanabaenaceae cyanobacterium]
MKHWHAGQGWRIGWDTDEHIGLLGADTWAFELSADEFQEFCRLAIALQENMQAIASELSDQETVTLEMTSELLTLVGEGVPGSFTLYLQLLRPRRAEGSWAEEAIPELMLAIDTLKSSCF